MRVFDRIASNAVVLLTWRFFQKGLSFVLVWFLVRWLTQAEFGFYSFILTWIATATAFTDLGGSPGGIQLWAENPARAAKCMGKLYRIRISAIAAGLAISTIAWLTFFPNLATWGLIIIAFGLTASLQTVAWMPFQAELQNSAPSRWAATNRLLVIFVVIGALLFEAPLWLVIGLESVLSLLFVVRLMRAAQDVATLRIAEASNPFAIKLPRTTELFRYMLPLGIANAIMMAFFRADVFMLMRMSGEKVLAEYAAAFRLTEPLLTFTGVIGVSLFPIVVSRKADGDQVGAHRSIMRSARLLPFAMTCCALIVSLNAPLIVTLLFGKSYALSATPMRWLAWTLPLSAWSYSWHALLIAEKRYGYNILLCTLALLGNVCGNLWAIPRYGAVGAAAMTVATESIWALGIFAPFPRSIAGSTRTLVAHMILAGLASSSLLIPLAASASFLNSAAATALVLPMLLAVAGMIGIITRDDIDGLRQYLRRPARAPGE